MKCEDCGNKTEHNFGNSEIVLCVECAGSSLVKNYPNVLNEVKEHAPDGRGSTTLEFKTRLLGVDKDGYAVYHQERSKSKILWVCPMNSHVHNRHDDVIQKHLRYNKSELPGGPSGPMGPYLTMGDDDDHIQITRQEKTGFGRNYVDLVDWMEDQEWAALSDFGEQIMNQYGN